jgi:8-oxo-dGTP pyrophosphatase MutT (NUDIX family)
MLPKTAISAGAIILHTIDGQIKIALAHRLRDTKMWVLPKGHVEPGETLQQTAIREVREETGLSRVQLLTYLGKIERAIDKNGGTLQKTIHYYLAYAFPTNPPERPDEAGFTEPGWFAPSEMLSLLPYEQERSFLKERLAELFS